MRCTQGSLDGDAAFAYLPAAMRSLPSLVVCALLATTAVHATATEPLQLAPAKGVVLLRNGQVLEGVITHAGDYYYISNPPRSEIRLKTSDVEKVASRREDLYEQKRKNLNPTEMQERLDLAEWCVEQKLVDQAAKELAEAALLEPYHPRIALIQRRLEVARSADAQTPVVSHAAENGPSTEELDRFVRGLPGHAVETFTSSIQPLLVNSCTNSGCHGPRSAGKLRLLRLPLGTVNRRTTQRNLYAAWQVIDPDRPAASPLLTQPVQPHGNAKGAIFSGRETAQYRQLVAWVYEITRQRRPAETSDDEPSGPAPRQAARNERKRPATIKPPPSGDAKSEKQLGPDIEESEGTIETVTFTQAKDPAKVPRGQADRDDDYRPVDPFDPEIFNRRYFPP